MRFKLLSVLSILLLVGSNDARPSKLASPEIVEATNDDKALPNGVSDDSSSSWRPIEPRSSSVVKTDSRSELKDLQYMDQSLRTVATQLLNVTSTDESKDQREKAKSTPSPPANILITKKEEAKTSSDSSNFGNSQKSDMEFVREINSDIVSMGSMGAGRPTNSKFGYFESSHPGQAMAMTEEELEREFMTSSTTRLITAHKNHPTTTGGISTWILLNPPTTTNNPAEKEAVSNEVNVKLQNKLPKPVEIFETTLKDDAETATTLEKIVSPQSTIPMERITTLTEGTTQSLKKTTGRPAIITEKTEKIIQQTENMEDTEVTSNPKTTIALNPSDKTIQLKETITTPKTIITTRKYSNSNRSTIRPKIIIPKATNVTSKPMTTKLSRPANQPAKSKPTPARRTSTKSSVETTKNPNTSKIEKVTFRPVHMITTPKDNVEIFVTKIRTSFITDSSAKLTADSQSSSMNSTTKKQGTQSGLSDIELSEIATKTNQIPTKTNNVLKVQLKKPAELSTNIEIEPIKVNPPVLRIEKIDLKDKSPKKNLTNNLDSVKLENSRINVEFDFKPEAQRIIDTTTSVGPSSATTKRPHKRKKNNKLRRRKPTTTVAPISVTSTESTSDSILSELSTIPTIEEIAETLTELGIVDNTIQESKIEPESKVTSVNGNKNKKKQVQKPIGTQIYNFLSREVMPSFGVMSLVGLGLGLASYFLYPFSGAIARRNYVVEPNYKYNMDEYGGNYGQKEEEVFSKVLQGMTNQDGKYGGIKDYENNFYRYQQSYDGPYNDESSHKTRRVAEPSRYSTASATIYRPSETANYDNTKYRNTEFKYPEISTTPYEKKPDFVGKNSGDRQFVVGNVPKEYGYEEKSSTYGNTLPITTEHYQTNFHPKDNYKYLDNPTINSPSYANAEALKSNDDYEEIEITPSAVAVEHGPRSLGNRSPRLRRRKRDSVIQLIPSRMEIEKEVEEIEKEEPLSNEILDIIDSVIPGEISDKEIRKINKKNELDEKHNVEKKASGDETNGKQVKPIPEVDMSSQSTSQKPQIAMKKNEGAEKTTEIPEMATEKITEKSIDPSEASKATPNILDDSSSTSTTTTTTDNTLTIDEILRASTEFPDKDPENSSTTEWFDQMTTMKPHEESFNVFNFVKRIAEVKLKLGVAILKHASEGFARYLGHVQKRINGEE